MLHVRFSAFLFFWRIYFLGIQIEFFYMTEPVMSKRIWVKLGVKMNSMTWDFHFMEGLFHLVYGCRFALCQIFCCLVLLSFCMFIPEYEIVVWSIMCSSNWKFNSKFCLHVSFDVTFLFLQVYSTSVAMLLTAVVSVFLFGFHLSLAFFLGSTWDLMFFLIYYLFFFHFSNSMKSYVTVIFVFCSVVSVSVYLHSIGKPQSKSWCTYSPRTEFELPSFQPSIPIHSLNQESNSYTGSKASP